VNSWRLFVQGLEVLLVSLLLVIALAILSARPACAEPAELVVYFQGVQQHRIGGIQAVSAITPVRWVDLERTEHIAQTLSRGLPHNPRRAAAIARARVQQLEEQEKSALQQAWQGRLEFARLGIPHSELPVAVYQGRTARRVSDLRQAARSLGLHLRY